MMAFFLGALCVWTVRIDNTSRTTSSVIGTAEDCEGAYPLINPWLRCEPEQNLAQKKEFSDFKESLVSQIRAWSSQGRITHGSVYVRDLEFGPWMGINEDEIYSAASLLKVPVMITILRLAEKNPAVLGQRVEITPELIVPYNQEFPAEKTVEAGKVYTIDELLEYMIVYSDNHATNALHAYLQTISPAEPLFLVMMEEMGLFGENRTTDDGITVKQSASMFRHLYNASFLTKDYSEKALELLQRSTFNKGIVATLPDDVQVAHKFGEREDETGIKQLHDCGIVYHPGSNYLLCVMLRGRDMDVLANTISDISRMIYDEVSARDKEGKI